MDFFCFRICIFDTIHTYTLYIFCASMALWNSFGDIQPSRFVSKSWNACEVVKSVKSNQKYYKI